MHFLITAGGTREYIDPVRFISNASSGQMGYALASAAIKAGHKATLISAADLQPTIGVDFVGVDSAAEMFAAVKKFLAKCDCLIMAAAVADYLPASEARDKIKKKDAGLSLEMEPTLDILGSVEGDFIRVGFAAESGNLVENAKQKLQQKGLNLIVGNDITAGDSGFGSDNDRVTIIDRDGTLESLPLLPKREVADKVLDRVAKLLDSR